MQKKEATYSKEYDENLHVKNHKLLESKGDREVHQNWAAIQTMKKR